MKPSIIPSQVHHLPRQSMSLWHRAARRLVIGRLSRMKIGCVQLVDELGGETIGRPCPAAPQAVTLHVRDPRFYRLAVLGGSLGVAEAYIRGYWSCEDLTALFRIFTRNLTLGDRLERRAILGLNFTARLWHRLRANTLSGSRRNIAAHYDLGNDFFELMLDPTMLYSCGIFESPAASMHEASLAKLDRICRKLQLSPEDHVIEIGTGWGGFAIHAAKHFGCRVTTTTISREQHDLAGRRIEEAGLSDRITLLLEDYRKLQGPYDKLVSIEMIEAVGRSYLPGFFGKCASLLKTDGQMLIQGITMNEQRYEKYCRSVDFIQRYVFPGAHLPSVSAMMQAVATHTDLSVGNIEQIGPHYATTLSRWREAFHAGLGRVRAMGYPETFIRLWNYYLCYCEAGFAERYIGNVQMLLTKPSCRREAYLPALMKDTR